MDRSSTAVLVAVTYTTDNLMQEVATETNTTVYCAIDSVTGTEFAQAGQLGVKPEYRLTMFRYDYNGEQIVILGQTRYKVYRTYQPRKGDDIELYLERSTGP